MIQCVNKEALLNSDYEVHDHLGNVRQVYGDARYFGIDGSNAEAGLTLKEQSSYYPFGMQIASLSYSREDYTFGMQGMIRDDEMKGAGNVMDFGARLLGSREGRFFSVDPLAAKYPGESAFSSFGNNPIIYIDPDGRDYALYVNHNNQTITVKATYVDVSENAKNNKVIKDITTFWNSQSGKYDYKVQNGDNSIYYSIIFKLKEINLTELDKIPFNFHDIENNVPIHPDKGPVNYVEVLPSAKYNKKFDKIKSKGHNNKNGMFINKSEYGLLGPVLPSHEAGHGMGMTHTDSGLPFNIMTKKPTSRSTFVSIVNILDMLGQAGIGENKSLDKDAGQANLEGLGRPYGPSNSRGSGYHSSGEQPNNFENGEVIEK